MSDWSETLITRGRENPYRINDDAVREWIHDHLDIPLNEPNKSIVCSTWSLFEFRNIHSGEITRIRVTGTGATALFTVTSVSAED